MSKITEQLGGYQHIVSGDTQQGDMLSIIGEDGRELITMPNVFAGFPVDLVEYATGARVYRKVPVAKQGGGDEGVWTADHATDCSRPCTVTVPQPSASSVLPEDAKARKRLPLATGVIDYFPDALLAVAEVSFIGNEQHHPGQPLHWDRSKSTDEADAMMRHFVQRGTRDTDGARHTAKMVWRGLAFLQKEIEHERAAASSSVSPKA